MENEVIVEEELPIVVEVEEPAAQDRPAFNEEAIRAQEEEDAQDIEKFPRPIQKRFQTLTYHIRERERQLEDERQNAAALLQYANGAKQLAEQLAREKEELQRSLQREALSSRDAQIATVSQEFVAAREAADVQKEVEANRKLAEISAQRAQIAQFQPQPAFQPPPPPQRQQTQQSVPEEAENWAKRNSWFGSDRILTTYAVQFSQGLTEQGLAADDPSYYNHIDAEMRKRFPEKFESSAMNTAKTQAPAQQFSRPPVATAARTSSATNGTRKVVLTASEAEAARRIGVPLEEYAKFVKRG